MLGVLPTAAYRLTYWPPREWPATMIDLRFGYVAASPKYSKI